MKTLRLFLLLVTSFSFLTLQTACRRNPNTVWEDTKTASRHVGRGVRSLGGKHGSSRQINSKNEFMPQEYAQNGSQQDYIPLTDDPNANDLAMLQTTPQPKETPGDPGSSIPGIEAFQDPSTHPTLSGIFRNIHFSHNSSLIKGQENLEVVKAIADYMRSNPNTYIFVEGHCDERGAEAYNLALGSHRSNSVRNLLINEGVNPDNIFSISYGKERPLLLGHDEEAWSQNRRAEFKVYAK
jgi:peptidoglycan-associated lipoprotein